MDTLRQDQYTLLIISRSFLLRMRNVSGRSCKIESKHILRLIIFFLKIIPFMRYVEKYGRTIQPTDDNIIRSSKVVISMLDN